MGATSLASELGKNLIINPTMELAQRGLSFAGLTSSQYVLDRWKWSIGGTTDVDTERSSDVPANIESEKSIKITNNSATPIGAGDTHYFLQRVEGFNIRSIKKKNLFASFYVKSSLVGFYSFTLFNGGGDQNFSDKLTINQANVWQKVIFRIPKVPTDLGVWNFINEPGLTLGVGLGTGTNSVRSTNFGEWIVAVNNNKVGITGQLDFGNNAGATFFMTQVQLHEGIDKIPFDRLIRPFSQEIELAQRYFEKSYDIDVAPGTAFALGRVGWGVNNYGVMDNLSFISEAYKTRKRTTPIITFHSFNFGTINRFSDVSGVDRVPSANIIGETHFEWKHGDASSSIGTFFHYTADAEL